MKKNEGGKQFNGAEPKKGEVWWAWVDFDGSEGGKERPVVVVRSEGNTVVVKICTTKGLGSNTRNKLQFPEQANLDRDCYVLDKTQRIPRKKMKRKMGDLDEEDKERIMPF